MLPIDMMNGVVDYQIYNNPPLPPVEQMIRAAEAHVERRELQYAQVEEAVMGPLNQLAEAMGVLDNQAAMLAADDPNRAVVPQIENIRQSLDEARRIYETTARALSDTQKQIRERTEQTHELKSRVNHLRNQAKYPKESAATGFLREACSKAAAKVKT